LSYGCLASWYQSPDKETTQRWSLAGQLWVETCSRAITAVLPRTEPQAIK